jgi:hypothetical protein
MWLDLPDFDCRRGCKGGLEAGWDPTSAARLPAADTKRLSPLSLLQGCRPWVPEVMMRSAVALTAFFIHGCYDEVQAAGSTAGGTLQLPLLLHGSEFCLNTLYLMIPYDSTAQHAARHR